MLVLISTSCAHEHRVKSVNREADSKLVRVGLGKFEAKTGEILNVYEMSCPVPSKGSKDCEKISVGKARVIEKIDSNDSLVEPQDNLIMTEDMYVEKIHPHHP